MEVLLELWLLVILTLLTLLISFLLMHMVLLSILPIFLVLLKLLKLLGWLLLGRCTLSEWGEIFRHVSGFVRTIRGARQLIRTVGVVVRRKLRWTAMRRVLLSRL
jgi:hypothetical protein